MISALGSWFLNQVIASINSFLFKFWYNSNSNSDINRHTLASGVCNPWDYNTYLHQKMTWDANRHKTIYFSIHPYTSTLQGNSNLKSFSHLPKKTLIVFFTCHTAETLLFNLACLTILQFVLEIMPSQFIQYRPAHFAAHSKYRKQEAGSLTQLSS